MSKRISDKVRIDWMECHCVHSEMSWRKIGGAERRYWVCDGFAGNNLRDAIDAAIRSEAKGDRK